jgi:CrcB protein
MTDQMWIGVGLVGGVGAVARFLLDGRVSQWAGRSLPLGTFVINVSGAFVLGLIAGLALSTDTSLLLGTAAVGSYTTFSTWMLETHRLGEDGQLRLGVANAVVSVVLGVGAAAIGRVIGAHL